MDVFEQYHTDLDLRDLDVSTKECYHFTFQELMASYEDALECLDLERELVSIMLHLMERSLI